MGFHCAQINTREILDWETFHSVFAEVMGFPDFYGKNMNAWADCMTYFDDKMTRFDLADGELFHLEIIDSADFQHRLPEIFNAFVQSAAFVNTRRTSAGDPPILALILK